jgi:uncharacterized protein (DUF3820 family)
MDIETRTVEPGNVKLTFGKHKGKTLSETPIKYLEWMLGEKFRGELLSDVAAFLSVPVPHRKRPYDGVTISSERLEDLQAKTGFQTVNAFLDGIDIMGVANCYDQFDPNCDWPAEQDWDGITAPWLDQFCESDREFVAMFHC